MSLWLTTSTPYKENARLSLAQNHSQPTCGRPEAYLKECGKATKLFSDITVNSVGLGQEVPQAVLLDQSYQVYLGSSRQ